LPPHLVEALGQLVLEDSGEEAHQLTGRSAGDRRLGERDGRPDVETGRLQARTGRARAKAARTSSSALSGT
jgi:hypothetical protein